MAMTTEALIGLLLSSAVLNFVQFLVSRSDANKKHPELDGLKSDIDEIKGSIKSILAENLSNSLNAWMKADERPHETWDIIADQYEHYHNLKGNHGIDSLFNIAKEIPPTE